MYISIALTSFVIGSLPFCFWQPWIGILVWTWLGHMNPHKLTWGFANAMPLAQMVALAVLGGLPFAWGRNRLPRTLEVYLLFALWGMFFLTTLFAFYPEDAWRQLAKVSKILLFTIITLLLFQDIKKLHALLWVTALSIGFYAIKGGIWAVLTGGGNQVLGPQGTFIEGNTALGLALNMILPFFIFLRREESRTWLRHLLLAIIVLTVIATLVTYSRGALLGLGAVLAVVFLNTMSRAKILALLLLPIALYLATSMLPDKWFTRMETISTYEQDESANSRLTSWHVAYSLALDHPFLGGGFRTFTAEIYERYVPGWGRDTDAHSIYLQVLGEHGFPGLALYISLILSTMLTLQRLKRRSGTDPSGRWISNCAQMLEASMAGYLVSGAFLSLSYFDLFYGLVAIAILLKVVAVSHQREAAPTKVTPGFATRTLAWRGVW